MDVMKKLVELLSKYFNIGDSYAYNLTRVKSAFACGTIGLDDFEEFDDETVEDIASYLIDNGVTVQEQDGCEYCNGLPFSQMEDFTMPNASKKDYDIVTIRYCPICGRRLPQPPKGE